MTSIQGLVQVAALWVVLALVSEGHADHRTDRMRVMAAVEAPRRPGNFADLDELNKYLENLRQYYTLIGRPRFGRSVRTRAGDRTNINLF